MSVVIHRLKKCTSRLQSAEELLRCITAYRNLRHLKWVPVFVALLHGITVNFLFYSIDMTVAKSMGIDGLFSAIQSLEELRCDAFDIDIEWLSHTIFM